MVITLIVLVVLSQVMVLAAAGPELSKPDTPNGIVAFIFACAISAPVLAFIAGGL